MMKRKLIKSIFLTAFCVFFATACQDALIPDDGTNIRDYSKIKTGTENESGNIGGGEGNGLYKNASGFDISVWGSWQTTTAPIASVTDGADGGVRLTSIDRPDAGTYMGVNMAPGTGSGANADLNGNGFTQIKCKLRGNVNPKFTALYIINGNDNEVGKDKTLDKYTPTLSETEWTEVTITGLKSTSKMSSALIVFVDNDGCAIEDWIEIKEIDWQDSSGNSVVPKYN
jgi:hypothetical protein